MASAELIVRNLGLVDYLPTLEAMRRLTVERDERTPDEIWLLQHPRVFTQGQAGKAETARGRERASPAQFPFVDEIIIHVMSSRFDRCERA